MTQEKTSEKLNKDILAEELSIEFGMSRAKARKILDKTFSRIKEVVSGGGKVSIYDFGIFEKKEKSERTGYSPTQGKKIKIESFSYPSFKPSQSFKSDLKNKD